MLLCQNMNSAGTRLSSERKLKMTIVSRADCHLCEVVSRMALSLRQEFPIEITKLSADDDPELLALYGHRTPVVLIDDIERCAGKITRETCGVQSKKRGGEDL